jgi:leucyl-tRNA synthetase
MEKYNPKDIEAKWQKYWEENQTFKVTEDQSKEKFFSLVEFPYPSGEGLHVGHPKSYSAMDVIGRKRRAQGQNVLYPIGFDAFGLPTENFAIKTGRQPSEVTAKNIANFTRQLKSLGFAFDWSRVVDTTDPTYYKWTQWIFLQLYKHGLAYKKNQPINWCPKDKTGLANEEVVGGCCERCGTAVEQRDKEQWMLAITKYADSLLEGLKDVDYIPQARTQQENWIGRSEGAEIIFPLRGIIGQDDDKHSVTVFTTRPDTIYGVTFLAISAELAKSWVNVGWHASEEVKTYIENTLKEQVGGVEDGEKEKTGVNAGIVAVNPVNNEQVPVWITNYVMGGVGTGAIMGVPAHDERDFDFARKFGLEIKEVISGGNILETAYTKDGLIVNSDFLNNLNTKEATEKIIAYLEETQIGKRKVNFKLRDWVFSRQRYWGEPIPLVHCENCKGWIPLPEDQLPLTLPPVEKYEPTDNGESPLAVITDWINTTCPSCGGPARRETDTMPNWAGSSWYFLRYTDPKNNTTFASPEALKYWMPVDLYNGGMEHVVLHLLYSRFWNQFLYDIGVVPTKEPYKRRTSQGMILASDGQKMSKSRGNVINPDEMVDQFGADSLRTYIMFMGPFDQAVSWDTNGLVGVKRFLERVWNLQEKVNSSTTVGMTDSSEIIAMLHQTIQKVSEDIEEMHFNTAVSQMMQLVNDLTKQESISKETYIVLIKLLAPFAPHISEELWNHLGGQGSVSFASWPVYDANLAKETCITIVVQVNGKVRDSFEVSPDISENDAKQKALSCENTIKYLEGKEPKKIIYVKGKLVSIVV